MPSALSKETFHRVAEIVRDVPAVDAHTHIQDDLTSFTAQYRGQQYLGHPSCLQPSLCSVIDTGVRFGRLVRRTMTDAAHALFYSWFAEIAEGAGNRLDHALRIIGANSDRERRDAARFLLGELHDSRYSEYAEWLRIMFRLYDGVRADVDPLDPAHLDTVWDAVAPSATTRLSRNASFPQQHHRVRHQH